jgi:urease accessory protein
MGTSADRITAADFLTPPELNGLRLASDGAGRIGGVRLELCHGPRGTYLGGLYQQVPLRLLPPFHFGADQPALVYLLNPTAGLLDGDGQLVELSAGPGVRAVVVGQSATRIHPCLQGFCTQQWRVSVAAGAVLVVLPGPAIPFQGCRYYQRVAIDLAPGAGLVWGDVWLAGRYSRGEGSERFQFATIVQELTVRRGSSLVYRDRFCWRGPWDAATAAWHFGPGPACGSLFVAGLAERSFAVEDGARFETAGGDLCLRWLGDAEAVTARVVEAALRAGACLADERMRAPWLLATGDLAPNHWFTLLPRTPSNPGPSPGDGAPPPGGGPGFV